MRTLPMYVWVIVLVGLIGTTAAICVMLWRGALTAGRCRRTATRVAAVTGIVWAAWAVANAALADAGVLRFAPGRTLPGIPMAVIAGLAVAFVDYPGFADSAHPGRARCAVGADIAADVSAGRRSLSGGDGTGPAASRVRRTRRVRRFRLFRSSSSPRPWCRWR